MSDNDVAEEIFPMLLDRIIDSGTQSPDDKDIINGPWTTLSLAHQLRMTPATINNWRAGRNFPQTDNFRSMLRVLFGENFHNSPEARKLVFLYNRQSPFYFWLKNADDLDDGAGSLEVSSESIEQISAAFRFGVIDQRIDALPANLEVSDPVVSEDLFNELRQKVDSLLEKVNGQNVEDYVKLSVAKTSQALNVSFENVRPGVLLSRLRTLESIRSKYDSDEGRSITFPDFQSIINDVCLSGQDLLATFPEIRRIERERLALELESSPEIISILRDNISAIQEAASNNDIVAEGAVLALLENDRDIIDSPSTELKMNLIGDKLLVTRNFVSEIIRSIASVSKKGVLGVWDVTKDDLELGVRQAARMLPPLAVIALLTTIAGPIAGIAGLIKSDAFRSVSNAASKVKEAQQHRRKAPKGNVDQE